MFCIILCETKSLISYMNELFQCPTKTMNFIGCEEVDDDDFVINEHKIGAYVSVSRNSYFRLFGKLQIVLSIFFSLGSQLVFKQSIISSRQMDHECRFNTLSYLEQVFSVCLHCAAQFSSCYQNAAILLISYIHRCTCSTGAMQFFGNKRMSTFLWMWRVFLESLTSFTRTIFKRIANKQRDEHSSLYIHVTLVATTRFNLEIVYYYQLSYHPAYTNRWKTCSIQNHDHFLFIFPSNVASIKFASEWLVVRQHLCRAPLMSTPAHTGHELFYLWSVQQTLQNSFFHNKITSQ